MHLQLVYYYFVAWCPVLLSQTCVCCGSYLELGGTQILKKVRYTLQNINAIVFG